jgi:hypothetical protein
MPLAKSSENTAVLVPTAAESSRGRNAGRVRLAKALAARPAAKIPCVAAPLAKAKKRISNRVKLSDSDYAQLTALKQRLQTLGSIVKKSQLLRAGMALLVAMNDIELTKAVAQVGAVKPRHQPQQAS